MIACTRKTWGVWRWASDQSWMSRGLPEKHCRNVLSNWLHNWINSQAKLFQVFRPISRTDSISKFSFSLPPTPHAQVSALCQLMWLFVIAEPGSFARHPTKVEEKSFSLLEKMRTCSFLSIFISYTKNTFFLLILEPFLTLFASPPGEKFTFDTDRREKQQKEKFSPQQMEEKSLSLPF